MVFADIHVRNTLIPALMTKLSAIFTGVLMPVL